MLVHILWLQNVRIAIGNFFNVAGRSVLHFFLFLSPKISRRKLLSIGSPVIFYFKGPSTNVSCSSRIDLRSFLSLCLDGFFSLLYTSCFSSDVPVGSVVSRAFSRTCPASMQIIGTNGVVHRRKVFNSHRICLEHQNDRRFIVWKYTLRSLRYMWVGLLTDRINNKLEESNLINEHALNCEPVALTSSSEVC